MVHRVWRWGIGRGSASFLAACASPVASVQTAADALPSWNEGPSKQADPGVRCDREGHVAKFDKALDAAPENGWVIVDMKKDWKVVFPER
jgi:hypothetical protein